jgi:hypothetical protein
MAVVVLVIGLCCIRPFFAWLNRVKTVKHGDTSLEMGVLAAEQQVSSPKTASGAGLLAAASSSIQSSGTVTAPADSAAGTDLLRGENLRNFGISPLVINRERAILTDLNNVQSAERESLLVRHLAIASLQLIAEQTYRLIFGSQLAMVQHLNLYGPTPKSKLLETFYEPAAAADPAPYAKIPPEGWFQYAVKTSLIWATDSECYAITQTGKAFLEWLVATGILASKPF